MSAYPRSASQFLASTFAPFGGQGAGRRDEVDQAPLFFSTVDGESAVGGLEEDEVDARSRYYYHDAGSEHITDPSASRVSSNASQRHGAYRQQHQPHQARGGPHEESDNEDGSMRASTSYHGADDPYNHDGLGRAPSEVESDGSDDPFRSHGTRSRQSAAPSSARSKQPAATAGWKMHATNLLPNVKQSVLHNLYEQSESVYSSVFIGNKTDKGKQRATEGDYQPIRDKHLPQLHPQESPSQPPTFLTHGIAPSLPLHNQASRQHPQQADTSDLQHFNAPRVHRFPMPTSRYRRTAIGVKDASVTAPDMEWQDQSYRDPAWLAIFLFNLLFTAFLSLYLLLFDSTPKPSSSHLIAPSIAILRSIPLLSLLVFVSLLITTSTLAYTLLIKNGARQAAFAFILAPPIVFLVGAGWAFEASFALEFQDPTGMQMASVWAQTSLRLTSIALLAFSGLAFKRSWQTLFSSGSTSRRARLERTIRVLQVSAEVIIQHPQLIILAIALVGAYTISSVPTILVIAQLLYHGTVKQGLGQNVGYTYLIPSTWSIILSLHTAFVYFWTLGLLRALYQHTIGGTVGTWWYSGKNSQAAFNTTDKTGGDEGIEAKTEKVSMLQAQQNVLDSIHRATGPSLGTLCASSLILAILSMITLLISLSYSLVNRSRRWTGPNIAYTALRVVVNFVVLPFIAILSAMIRNLNAFTLVYSAITGDKFWDASGEAADLIMGRNGTDMVASRKSWFHSHRYNIADRHAADLMVRSLLSIFSFALAFLGGLAGYVSSVYWLSAPSTFPDEEAKEVTMLTPLLVAFVCGIVPFWTVRFSSDLLSNA